MSNFEGLSVLQNIYVDVDHDPQRNAEYSPLAQRRVFASVGIVCMEPSLSNFSRAQQKFSWTSTQTRDYPGHHILRNICLGESVSQLQLDAFFSNILNMVNITGDNSVFLLVQRISPIRNAHQISPNRKPLFLSLFWTIRPPSPCSAYGQYHGREKPGDTRYAQEALTSKQAYRMDQKGKMV